MRRLVPAFPTILTVCLIAGCGGPDGGDGPRPEASSSPPTPVEEVASADVLDAGIAVALDARAAPGVVPCAEPESDADGEYVAICLAPGATDALLDADTSWRSWLIPTEYTPALDEGLIRRSVAEAAELLVDHVIDGPTMWDDSPAAWAGLDQAMGAYTGFDPDMQATIADTSAARLTNVDGWRDAAGLEPVTREGEPRVTVHSLEIDRIGLMTRGEGAAREAGVTLSVHAEFSQEVRDRAGQSWDLRSHASISATGFPDGATEVSVGGLAKVGLEVADGMNALPQLRVPADVPDGWAAAEFRGLRLALPAGVDPGELTVDAGEVEASQDFTGADGKVWHLSVDAIADPTRPGRWLALRGYRNVGLSVDGAQFAGAEHGPDDDGTYVAVVSVVVPDAVVPISYQVEWESTPEAALEEIRALASGLEAAPAASE